MSDQDYLVELSDKDQAEHIAHQYTYACAEDEKILENMRKKGLHRYHALEDHNYWVNHMRVRCPYCYHFQESKPIPRSQIAEMLKQ